VIKS